MHEIKDETSIVKPIIDQYTEYCKTCHNHKIFIESESILLCNKCGVQEYVLMNQNKPSYKDPPREYTFFAYKRINHFNEWLSQFQAKESTYIPDQIIEDLHKEIKKEKITDISKINTKRIRRFLKKLGYNKYYEHIPHIINFSRNRRKITRNVQNDTSTLFKTLSPQTEKLFKLFVRSS